MSGDGGAIAISQVVREGKLIEDFRFSATRSFPTGCIAISNVSLILL